MADIASGVARTLIRSDSRPLSSVITRVCEGSAMNASCKTETIGAGERRFAMRTCDVPQRRPRYLRELLRSEHGEATEAEDTDADRVR